MLLARGWALQTVLTVVGSEASHFVYFITHGMVDHLS